MSYTYIIEGDNVNGVDIFFALAVEPKESMWDIDAHKGYKVRTKKVNDENILRKEFKVRDAVLLFNSRLKLISGKLNTRWSGPFEVMEIAPHGCYHN